MESKLLRCSCKRNAKYAICLCAAQLQKIIKNKQQHCAQSADVFSIVCLWTRTARPTQVTPAIYAEQTISEQECALSTLASAPILLQSCQTLDFLACLIAACFGAGGEANLHRKWTRIALLIDQIVLKCCVCAKLPCCWIALLSTSAAHVCRRHCIC